MHKSIPEFNKGCFFAYWRKDSSDASFSLTTRKEAQGAASHALLKRPPAARSDKF